MKIRTQQHWLKTTAVVSFLLLQFTSFVSTAQVPQTEWAKEFLAAFNTNEPEDIKQMLVNRFHKGYHGTTKYWQSIHREFGPVDFFSMGKDSVIDRSILWTRSRLTENFVGFTYKLSDDDPPIIHRMGVLRGFTPSGIEIKHRDVEEAKARLDTYLDKLQEADAFSGVVLLAKGDEIIVNRAVNFADKDAGIKNELDTKFLIASTTKLFTTVAVAQLVEQGKLSYSDPISKFLPDYPKHIADKVTIHHLLTHTSGIELDEISAFNKASSKMKNLDELYAAHLKYLPKLKGFKQYELPETFNYTNEGFDLAGYIVQKVTGQSYYDYVAQHIFEPAAMTNTGDFKIDTDIPGLAKGYYTSNNGERQLNTKSLPTRSRPAGSFYASATDLFNLIQSMQNGKLIQQATFEKMRSAQVTSYDGPLSAYAYGYGITLERYNDVSFWGHAGVSPGVSTRCEVYPDTGYTVIVLSNYDRAGAIVANYIRDLLYYDLN